MHETQIVGFCDGTQITPQRKEKETNFHLMVKESDTPGVRRNGCRCGTLSFGGGRMRPDGVGALDAEHSTVGGCSLPAASFYAKPTQSIFFMRITWGPQRTFHTHFL